MVCMLTFNHCSLLCIGMIVASGALASVSGICEILKQRFTILTITTSVLGWYEGLVFILICL